jgi:N-acetyl-anhydromuramyl-L-alanine amidase AmpD
VLNLPVSQRLRREGGKVVVPRRGIMLHYDDSSRDEWAVDWFTDPRCLNWYTWLVLDNGELVEIAAPAFRTAHAGPCLTPSANSAFYGVSAATNGRTPVTPAQLQTIVTLCAELFRHHRWKAATVAERIVGHDEQAIWTEKYTKKKALWGTTGRKCDPTGLLPEKYGVVLSTEDVRRLTRDRLTHGVLAPITVTGD